MRTQVIALAAVAVLTFGLAVPTASAAISADVSDEVEAPADDGTGGANDIPDEAPAPETVVSEDGTESWETPSDAPPPPPSPCPPDDIAAEGGFTVMCAPLVCDPNHVWYKVTSSTKSGKVTRWSKHIKNDSTSETFNWSTTTTATIKASANLSGTISGEAALKNLAKVTLGIESNYGLEGQVASTSTYSRTVTFNRPGKWIIFRGVYAGTGDVYRYRCSSNGQSYSKTGHTYDATTFDKATVTGLINCANSVSDLVARAAKAKCG